MITHPLLGIGLLLVLGYWGGRAANAVKLPRVSGYLVAGMLLSPSFFNVLARRLIDQELCIVTEIALSIIAYSIGGSLVYDRLKRLGGNILWITVTQAVGAFLVTTAILVFTLPILTDLRGPEYDLLGTYLPMALVIGAMAVASAPGAVLAIISELQAAGPFTMILLGVIALSDGLAIIFFALASTAAHVLLDPGAVSWIAMLGASAAEISLSLLLGSLGGAWLILMARLVRRRESLLMVILGTLFLVSGIAVLAHLSALLANMVVGFIIINLERRHHEFFLVIEQIEDLLFGLFFSLAGAHLDLGVIKSAGLLALAILVVRMGGKQFGAWAGAKISRASKIVKNYLGLTLMPQAGVTIGLVLMAQEIFPAALASILVNAVIGAVIINELVAPPLVKYALLKAGEVAETGPSRTTEEDR